MKKSILFCLFFSISILAFAQQQVPSTNQGIANARPGDFIIRSNGQRVVLNQGDINYARRQLGLSTSPGSQNRPAQQSASPGGTRTSYSSNSDSNTTLIITIVIIIHIIITICIGNIKGANWAILYFFLAPIVLLIILGVTGAGGVKGPKTTSVVKTGRDSYQIREYD